jgi:acyl-CoA thioester hydrolase
MTFKKHFEIRWGDLDANRHVANSSYVDFLSDTRMSFFRENGITQQFLGDKGIGPVIFTEELYYIKEIHHGESITITIELLANTKDYKYIKYAHCIFNHEQKLSVYSETFYGWMDLQERKLISPPEQIAEIHTHLSKADRYELLETPVTLKNPKIPFGKNLA